MEIIPLENEFEGSYYVNGKRLGLNLNRLFSQKKKRKRKNETMASAIFW